MIDFEEDVYKRQLPGRTAIWARGLFIFQDKCKGKGERSYEGTGENL